MVFKIIDMGQEEAMITERSKTEKIMVLQLSQLNSKRVRHQGEP
jgi:hypothetical protein